MGEVQGKSDAVQRDQAAQIRQYDDNSGKKALSSQERNTVNAVIHSPDLKHSPKFDKPLSNLAKKHPGAFPK
ncbi:hypothetical protein I4U23_004093 [Adineta vaga]|nr:hypothetical protein I4U23_004093 [Adineta vaga]